MDDMFYYIVNSSGGITHTLQVDKITGSYSFMNQNKLWTSPIITPTLPSQGVAFSFLDNWFKVHGTTLPAAMYRGPVYAYLVESSNSLTKPSSPYNKTPDQPTSSMPIDVMMTYPRQISTLSHTASGLQLVDYPIVGPGGRLVAYLGDQSELVGMQGGSRDVQSTGSTVPVLDSSAAWAMLVADHSLAIPQLPYEAERMTYAAPPILAYYEMTYLLHQSELVPVWVFLVDFSTGGIPIADDVPVYVPASMSYMPPDVAITNPLNGSTYISGEQITFEGSITGGTPPFIIEWFASKDGYLGGTLSLTHSLTWSTKDIYLTSQDITLQVIDANGLTGTALITVNILPIFWLPMVTK